MGLRSSFSGESVATAAGDFFARFTGDNLSTGGTATDVTDDVHLSNARAHALWRRIEFPTLTQCKRQSYSSLFTKAELMALQHLSTYLNDHLAGSVTAIELLQYVASSYAHTEVETFANLLRDEVMEDRKTLEELMERLAISQSTSRKASAWVGEKFAQLKLRLDDPKAGSLLLLEATDALSLGIEGKKLLWRALATAADTSPELRTLDYQRLIERADDQRARVEAVRLEAGKGCLVVRS